MKSLVPVRLLFAVAIVMAAPASFAHAEETLIWTAKASDGFASLSYGPLDPAKAPVFLLSCFDAMGIAVLDVRQEVDSAKQGDPLAIVVSAGGAKAEITGEAARDAGTGMTFAEASDFAVKPVLEVLRQAGAVTVTSGNVSTSLSDSGRMQAVDQFTKDCPLE